MDRSELWGKAFANSLRMLDMNLQGFGPELAAQRVDVRIASGAWILAHMTVARRGLLKAMGAPQPEDPALAAAGRGSEGQVDLPLDELVDRLKATREPLKAAFMAVEDWDRVVLNPALKLEQPLELLVSFAYMHECYHLGQLGLIRKLQGLPGAM